MRISIFWKVVAVAYIAYQVIAMFSPSADLSIIIGSIVMIFLVVCVAFGDR